MLNLVLSSSRSLQAGSHLSASATEDLKQEVSTSEDQEVAEVEEKLPDQIQSLKEVGGRFLCLKVRSKVQQ